MSGVDVEWCVICGDGLTPRDPPHCDGCDLDDEHEYALHNVAEVLTVMPDEHRRELNAKLIVIGSRYVADSLNNNGYRELAAKCAELENAKETAVLAERERVLLAVESALAAVSFEAPAGQWRVCWADVLTVTSRMREGK